MRVLTCVGVPVCQRGKTPNCEPCVPMFSSSVPQTCYQHFRGWPSPAMKPCCSSIPFHAHVRHVVSRVFFAYGRVVARFPWLFILLPVVTLGALGAGLITMEQSDALDEIHMPRNSPAFVVMQRLRRVVFVILSVCLSVSVYLFV